MRYHSTRGHGPVDLTTALLHGPAPDGGLYLPETLPALAAGPAGPLAAVAARVLAPFLAPPLEPGELSSLLADALDFPVPLVPLDGRTRVLELGHGPSGAFKDVGARVLARCLQRLAPPPPGGLRTVLVATSGDTGGAVARAFQGLAGFRVVVLFPRQGVSEVQRRLFTAAGGNVRAVAVEGPFDACQRLARLAFARADLRARHGLTSANSLNLGRLLPQMAYYVHAAALLQEEGAAPPRFVVPSGNLGNLTAGLMAARMGMPHQGFVAALNANDAFRRYLAGEDPDRGGTVRTLSNAMDVGEPSNLERIRALWQDDRRALGRVVEAHSVDDAETRACMARVWKEYGYLADPHTAVGLAALDRARRVDSAPETAVVLSTAHPGKFPAAVRDITGQEAAIPPGMRDLAPATEHATTIEDDLEALVEVLAEGTP